MLFGFGDKALKTDITSYASPRKRSGQSQTISDAEHHSKVYDYIIIGGGTAGSVLASRLSEDPKTKVLVLEAGGDNRPILETKVPATFSKLFHSKHDWDYYTTPQSQVANRELFWPRGRMIGGSSSMNAMMSHTCDRQDFDEWRDRFGCEGWSYSDLLPYMRRSEKFTPNPDRPAINGAHRGDAGTWQTGYSWLSEIGEKGFLGACEDVGIPYNPDINTPEGTLGCTRFQTFIDGKGQRSSAATAYLPQTVVNRTNLDIAVDVRVVKILFDMTSDPDSPQAIGVEVQTERGETVHEVYARKEVLLCGGAINTPQTLILSGIGPEYQLKKHDIPIVKVNETVGKNLKDHFCTTPIVLKARPGSCLDYLNSDLRAVPDLLRWLITGGGPLTSNFGEAAAFIRSTDASLNIRHTSPSSKPRDYGTNGIGPDIEIIGAPIRFVHHGEELSPGLEDHFSLVPIGLRPQSTGDITLRTRSVWDAPLIDPRYWTDADDNDRKVLLAGLRVCLRIIRSPAMDNYLVPVERDDDINSYWWPYSATDVDAITDEQLRRWMGRKAFTLYHPVGTARMGPKQDGTAVVDLHCRVHGVKGLRVVDASVFPEQISGHPTATIIAMAEKVADLIRDVVSVDEQAKIVVPVDSRVPVAA